MITRNSNFILNEYNNTKWPLVVEIIQKEIKNGENNISRILSKINRELRTKSITKIIEIIAMDQKILLPREFAISGNQALISNKILSYVNKNTTHIVELGSGYGRNLFWLWSLGGPNLNYHGLEYTENGRKAANLISSVEKQISYESSFFDFHKPDLSCFHKSKGEIIFFTVHSIEQIPKLKQAFFSELLKLNKKITVIHFEPFGWQTDTKNSLLGSFEKYALKNDYNCNLFYLIKSLEKEKLVNIEEILVDYICINKNNGTSILTWKPC